MYTNTGLFDENAFAEAHHSIVDRFLRSKRLPYGDYYDVVVFGFLRAVRQYCSRPELREKYDFNAMAWRKMTDDLSDHFKKQSRPSRKAVTVSFESLYYDGDTLTRTEIVADKYQMTDDVEAGMLWDKVAGLLTEEQIETLRLRADGYTDREIAARRQRRVRDVEVVFDGIRAAVACLDLAMEGCGI